LRDRAPKVVVADYGSGNLLSVAQALRHVGAEVTVSDEPATVAAAERLVVPGVGAFAKAMAEIRARGLEEPIRKVAGDGRPLLGICLGMELMFDSSEEFGRHAGLGLIPGCVEAIPPTSADGRPHKIPHIGWNALRPPNGVSWRGTVLDGMKDGFAMYFVHSFTALPESPADWLAETDYDGIRLCAAVRRGNLVGFQGHLEKSGKGGLAVLKRFVRHGAGTMGREFLEAPAARAAP
jgi:glutamine amidotransferase